MRRLLRILLIVLLLLLLGAALLWFWPPPDLESAPSETALDLAMPAYHHREIHQVPACAAPAAIDRAIREVRASEIRGFELLMGLRQMRGQSIKPASQMPLFEAMKKANFVPLADLPQQEIVYGTIGPFWELRGARGPQRTQIVQELRAASGDPGKFASLAIEGTAKAAINFRIQHVIGEPCPRLVTETRIYCPRAEDLRAFTRYWRMVYPGSAYLRRNWLEAIVRRAR